MESYCIVALSGMWDVSTLLVTLSAVLTTILSGVVVRLCAHFCGGSQAVLAAQVHDSHSNILRATIQRSHWKRFLSLAMFYPAPL